VEISLNDEVRQYLTFQNLGHSFKTKISKWPVLVICSSLSWLR